MYVGQLSWYMYWHLMTGRLGTFYIWRIIAVVRNMRLVLQFHNRKRRYSSGIGTVVSAFVSFSSQNCRKKILYLTLYNKVEFYGY